jgi:hypothetical protein
VENVGGFIGYYGSGTISNCFSAGVVDGNDSVGGFLGYNPRTSVSGLECYWDRTRNPMLPGVPDVNSPVVTAKSTVEMQSADTYVAWGCGNHWTIDDGRDYPHLTWEGQVGEIITKPVYGGGTGDPNDPYLIRTGEHLTQINLAPCDRDKSFLLTTDIDMPDSGIPQFDPIKSFKGIFDGDGHSITNLRFSDDQKSGGLFSYVNYYKAEIKNLILVEPDIICGLTAGALVARFERGRMENCGVIGGHIAGGSRVGGLIGDYGTEYNDNRPTIYRCFATADVSGNNYVGGLIGQSRYGNIYDSYARGNVAATGSSAGGLIGSNGKGWLTNCYSAGTVSGSDAGGLVGSGGRLLRIYRSFWDIETSGQSESHHGSGKTTAEMKNADTFVGWSLSEGGASGEDYKWTICEGTNYPRLSWQVPAADIACPDGVTEKDFSLFAQHWWSSGCTALNDYCGGADLDRSGQVDGMDFAIFADEWLEGTE